MTTIRQLIEAAGGTPLIPGITDEQSFRITTRRVDLGKQNCSDCDLILFCEHSVDGEQPIMPGSEACIMARSQQEPKLVKPKRGKRGIL